MIKVLNHLYIFIFSFPLFLLHEPRVFTRGFCIVRSPDRQFVQGAVGIVPACHPEQAQRAEGSVSPSAALALRRQECGFFGFAQNDTARIVISQK